MIIAQPCSMSLSITYYFDFLVITTAFPVITLHPNENGNITVAEDSDVVLRCKATGDEPSNYQWMRVSGSLPKNAKRGNNG